MSSSSVLRQRVPELYVIINKATWLHSVTMRRLSPVTLCDNRTGNRRPAAGGEDRRTCFSNFQLCVQLLLCTVFGREQVALVSVARSRKKQARRHTRTRHLC